MKWQTKIENYLVPKYTVDIFGETIKAENETTIITIKRNLQNHSYRIERTNKISQRQEVYKRNNYAQVIKILEKNIFNSAKYIASKLNGIEVDKLQMLLFYTQAYSLIYLEKPLFEETFDALSNGPSNAEIKKFAINKYAIYDNTFDSIPDDYEFNDKEKAVLDLVIKTYGNLRYNKLQRLVCSEEPWCSARIQDSKKTISKDKMKEYYTKFLNNEGYVTKIVNN